MRVTVRYFAAAAEAAGLDEEVLSITEEPTLAALKLVLAERYGEPMLAVMKSGSFLIDDVVRRDPAAALTDRVDVLPPFAGG